MRAPQTVAIVSATLQTLIPLNGRTQNAQESFLLAFASVKLLAKTLKEAKASLDAVSSFDDANASFTSMCEQLGVSQEAVRAACIRDFVRVFDHLESVLIKAQEEAELAGLVATT